MRYQAVLLVAVCVAMGCNQTASTVDETPFVAATLAVYTAGTPKVDVVPSIGDKCDNCNGTGKLGDGRVVLTCPICKGTGKVATSSIATPDAVAAVDPGKASTDGFICDCENCDNDCKGGKSPCRCGDSDAKQSVAMQSIGADGYEDAVNHVQTTGESVQVFFLDSRIPEMPEPRSGYVCDLAEHTKAFADYWLGKDTAPVTRTMIRLDTGKVASGEWYTSHPSVVKATATTRRTVRRLSGPTWNWAGADGKGKAWHLANEPEHASAGLTIEQLQGLSDRELNAIHDNLHNSGNRNPWGTGGGQLNSLPILYQQSSGPCPGGNCPSPSRSRGRWGR